MFKEIGSDYALTPISKSIGVRFPCDGSLVFSGRTAIEAVLKCIPNAKTALLPSYCCDSMIVPFQKAGLRVSFFETNYKDEFNYRIRESADILLWNNYFGFSNDMPEFDGIIIEDITHSLLSENQYHQRSDYYVASLRKWEPIASGGFCSVATDYLEPPKEYLDLKLKAMDLKTSYLAGKPIRKDSFLNLFRESNEWLKNNYSGLSIDKYSKDYLDHVDVEKQRRIRRANAKALYDGLDGIVQFMFPVDQMDCPLFVPIILSDNRDKVRRHLIQNNIYCPIHWPHPNAECESNIYDMELSLICDQRYGEEDMRRIVDTLKVIL